MADISVLNTTAQIQSQTLITEEGNWTITGTITFDADPGAPFAVTSGSAVVTNLDADKLDGAEGSAYAQLAQNETITGDWVVGGTTPNFTIGDGDAEDAQITFNGNAQDYYIGLDDTADDLVIGLGSTVGTTPSIAIDENQVATFTVAPDLVADAPASPNLSSIYQDSICKAWAYVSGGNPPTLNDDYNVTSLTRTALGVVRVNFATALPDANYAAIPTTEAGSAKHAFVSARTTGYVEVTSQNSAGTEEDNDFSVIVFGS